MGPKARGSAVSAGRAQQRHLETPPGSLRAAVRLAAPDPIPASAAQPRPPGPCGLRRSRHEPPGPPSAAGLAPHGQASLHSPSLAGPPQFGQRYTPCTGCFRQVGARASPRLGREAHCTEDPHIRYLVYVSCVLATWRLPWAAALRLEGHIAAHHSFSGPCLCFVSPQPLQQRR